MSEVEVAQSKTHKGENFPVASMLVAPAFRAPILAYYRFARAADDIADSGALAPDEKLARLDAFEATLLGRSEAAEAAKPLRTALAADRRLSLRHALDLLSAFRMDAVKSRYASFDELMAYCACSAAPVGRFVLDVHGESPATWPVSDALCAALQIINHIQDCGADFRRLDRVYVPLDLIAARGARVADLAAPTASAGLRAALVDLAARAGGLVEDGARLPAEVRDLRLRLETGAIAALARRLVAILLRRDPLSEETHLSKPAALLVGGAGAVAALLSGARRSQGPASKEAA